MRRCGWIGLGLLSTAILLAPLSAESQSPPAQRETKERVSSEQRKIIVAGPMAMVDLGDLEGGRAAFESLLAWARAGSGPNSLVEADLLSSFAVELFNAENQEAAIPYFKRAADAFRARFSENHPETALAVTDYGRALEETYPSEARPEALAALSEALGIRLATLGSDNAETAMSMAYLAKALSRPERLQGDASKVDEIVALLRRAIIAVEAAPNALPRDEYAIRHRLVVVLQDNGRLREARVEQKALDHAEAHPTAAQSRNAAIEAERNPDEAAAEDAAQKAIEEATRIVT